MKTRLKTALFLLCLALILTPLPVQGSGSTFDAISLSLEKEIGASTYQDILSKKKVVQLDVKEQQRLNTIFSKLAVQSARRNEVKYNLTVVEDKNFNAFALPGGYVFVNTGLLSFTKNDSELAGVLGHEIAHIDRRHSMQSITRQVGATLLVGYFLSRGNSSNRKKMMAQLSGIALYVAEQGYSREAEFQADRYGVTFMRQAGYNKQDLINMWRRVHTEIENGKTPSKMMVLISSHPPTVERIKRIEAMQ
jgi:beta-barrel assembly-enhancing protease